ncbi:MAG: RNA polymerase sigma factor [Chloroflexi bacterium]|nr:RNA polymerase sigma factor [Chloroflexota bacterium]
MQHQLVQRARNGDHDAFSALVEPEFGRLYGLAGLILGTPTGAEDAVQEALLKAWRDLPALRDADRFQAWLRRLVINACHDEGRRLGRRRGEVALAPEHQPAIGDGLDGIVQRDELAHAFGRLSNEERTVIALRYYLDLSSAEAARALGLREVTYRSRLHRAIRSLGSAMVAADRSTDLRGRWA